MVKDEDVCLHCGLCAERCPTAAWDMSEVRPGDSVCVGNGCSSGGQRMSGINDFAFKMATVNGTGSASANSLLMQAIFRMGIPVTGKNVFPSNIQGLPTWYEIRVSKDGYTARPRARRSRRRAESGDVREGRRRGAPRRLPALRLVVAARRQSSFAKASRSSAFRSARCASRTSRATAIARCCATSSTSARSPRCSNSTWTSSARCCARSSRRRRALLDANFTRDPARLRLREGELRVSAALPSRADGRDEGQHPHRRQHRRCARRRVRRRDGRRVVSDHAVDVADGSVQGILRALPRRPGDEASASTALIQAEDELAAAGMVIGAGWAGARSFTSTAGPGISLMSEFIGLAYYTEIPAVFFDIQRTGPSTGMPTRTQQGDLLSIAYSVARRHEAHRALPGESGGVLLPRRRSVRSRRAISDAGVRRVRSRHRDERLDVQALHVGRQLSPRSRQGARRRRAREGREVLALPRSSTATASRRARCPGVHPRGALLHARLGTRQARHVHRGLRRVSGGRRSAGAEVRDGGAGRAGAGIHQAATPTADDRHHLDRRMSRRGARGGRPAARQRASTSTTCASARSPSDRGVREFLEAHPQVLRRRAESRRPAALAARHRDRHRRATA